MVGLVMRMAVAVTGAPGELETCEAVRRAVMSFSCSRAMSAACTLRGFRVYKRAKGC